jgi:hypothetical protein
MADELVVHDQGEIIPHELKLKGSEVQSNRKQSNQTRRPSAEPGSPWRIRKRGPAVMTRSIHSGHFFWQLSGMSAHICSSDSALFRRPALRFARPNTPHSRMVTYSVPEPPETRPFVLGAIYVPSVENRGDNVRIPATIMTFACGSMVMLPPTRTGFSPRAMAAGLPSLPEISSRKSPHIAGPAPDNRTR